MKKLITSIFKLFLPVRIKAKKRNTKYNAIIYQRPFLIFIMLILVLASACSDNGSGMEENPAVITGNEAMEAVAQVLQDHGLIVSSKTNIAGQDQTLTETPELTSDDYLTTEVKGDEERIVYLSIGPDGHFIPSGAWRDAHSDYCKDQNRYMKEAVKVLRFKLFRLSDGYDVFVQYIDVETGIIEEQREGQADPGPNALKKAVQRALDKLLVELKPSAGPCERMRGVKFIFDSKIALTGETTIVEHTTVEIALAFDEKQQAYLGDGKLRWILYKLDAPDDCSAEVNDLPYKQKTKVLLLTLPQKGSSSKDNTKAVLQFGALEGSIVYICDESPVVAQFVDIYKVLHAEEVDDIQKQYPEITIRDWEAFPDDDQIIARKVYDRTIPAGEGSFVEKTTIEIKRQ